MVDRNVKKRDVTEEVEALEETLRLAMVSSNIEMLDTLISESLLFTNHLGRRLTKEDDINLHKSGDLRVMAISLSEMDVEAIGDIAIVSVRANIDSVYQGTSRATDFRFTRVWAKEDCAWVVVAGHSSVVV